MTSSTQAQNAGQSAEQVHREEGIGSRQVGKPGINKQGLNADTELPVLKNKNIHRKISLFIV